MRGVGGIFVLVTLAGAAAYTGAQSKSNKAPEKKPAASTARGNVAKGKAVYADSCGVCHYSANAEKKIGPGLRGIYKRGKFADGKKVDDATMRDWIVKGGVDMPSFEDVLTEEQIKDLIAYLRTL